MTSWKIENSKIIRLFAFFFFENPVSFFHHLNRFLNDLLRKTFQIILIKVESIRE
jgi:hypothetical protein